MSTLEFIMQGFKDKGVIVTGAKGQLGTEICRAFRDLGAKVLGIDLMENGRDSLEGIDYHSLDITDEELVQELFSNIKDGVLKYSILINNAGHSTFDHYLNRTIKDFDQTIAVNLRGNFICTREFVKLTSNQQDLKFIVNISSIYGNISPDFRIYENSNRRNSEIYGATKAGVKQLTKYFAVELASQDYRVNCIAPGGIYNEINPQSINFINKYSDRCPLQRMALAKEIIPAILFFSSNSSSYITGQELSVDGGYTIW